MADRAKALLTDDGDLTSLAVHHEVRVMDSRMYVASRRE
jgi:hypothetical protein